ncbi:hypothetical protein NDU88_006010 [Pleurodeles waltl]|uniref:Uncharacterized protein n=1 Tax=Pleurodeles waltl TaxID=8319 RepID=A0AAV7TC36_PLEWA|nr:hypothetical protein NDU88_006010 [Pleurodeles waltl]
MLAGGQPDLRDLRDWPPVYRSSGMSLNIFHDGGTYKRTHCLSCLGPYKVKQVFDWYVVLENGHKWKNWREAVSHRKGKEGSVDVDSSEGGSGFGLVNVNRALEELEDMPEMNESEVMDDLEQVPAQRED